MAMLNNQMVYIYIYNSDYVGKNKYFVCWDKQYILWFKIPIFGGSSWVLGHPTVRVPSDSSFGTPWEKPGAEQRFPVQRIAATWAENVWRPAAVAEYRQRTWLVVWTIFLFFQILGRIIPTD